MKLTFGSETKFEVTDLSGYRMAACIQKDKGFGNNFFVFALEQRPWSLVSRGALPGPVRNSGVSGQNSWSVPRGGQRHPVLLGSWTPG